MLALHDHSGHLVSEVPQRHPHIFNLGDSYLTKKGYHVPQRRVILIIIPGLNKDAGVFLQQEVISYIVNYDCFL